MPVARIYVVRHGETAENRESIIQGHLDTALNEAGVEQARLVADALRSVHFDAAYSSDLQRALKTGQMILVHRPDIDIRQGEELRERFCGDLQGKKGGAGFKMAAAVDETVEPAEAFAARAVGWWKTAILQRTLGLPPREVAYNVLVTSHGGFINTLVRALIGSRKVRCAPGVVLASVPNSSVTVIEVERDGVGTVVQFGDVAHLTPKLEREMVETNVDEVVGDVSGLNTAL
ncbi:phosphoglycerate mutase-like protein [Mycena maculata]|uniref:Phosphoglycerate mutase-like protein n=1 Tax=Mycena maculata TaxID=230809 RepID=A0AAD7MWG3_9AGAR|nr:phosphoglycerate mutase-like protein [Mycena maculata]